MSRQQRSPLAPAFPRGGDGGGMGRGSSGSFISLVATAQHPGRGEAVGQGEEASGATVEEEGLVGRGGGRHGGRTGELPDLGLEDRPPPRAPARSPQQPT